MSFCNSDRMTAAVKGRLNETVARPTMMYGLEIRALSKTQEAELGGGRV